MGLAGPEIIAQGVQPDAAVEFWKQRAKLTDEQAKALGAEAKQRAFYVTGLAKQDLVQLVSDGIQSALENGETLADFKKRIAAAIEAQGWHAHRVENIFRTNMQTAYSAGRYKKMQAVKASRPYWQYIAVTDKRVRPSHAILHELVYPADHEFWASNYPPNGFRCRCGVRTLSERQVKKQGLTVQKALVSGTLDRFDAEEDPEGNKWKPSRRAQEEGGKTLSDTAILRRSVEYATAGDKVMVGSNLPYALIHQKGGTIKPKTAKRLVFKGSGGKKVFAKEVTIPARPYLGVSDEDREEVQATIADFLADAFKP